jgi:hypothetical protein
MDSEENLNSSLIRRSSRKSILPIKFKDDNFITQITKPVQSKQHQNQHEEKEESTETSSVESSTTTTWLALNEDCEARDKNGDWYKARIIKIDNEKRRVKIHYQGWNSRYDQWFDFESESLRKFVEPTTTTSDQESKLSRRSSRSNSSNVSKGEERKMSNTSSIINKTVEKENKRLEREKRSLSSNMSTNEDLNQAKKLDESINEEIFFLSEKNKSSGEEKSIENTPQSEPIVIPR